MTVIDRRTFLMQAGVPLIFGLAELEGQEPAPDAPAAWLPEALARMKKTGRWGIVIVAPKDPQIRFHLGRSLWALTAFEDEDLEAHDLVCQTVLIAMSAAQAMKHFQAGEGVNRILLSHEGKVLSSDAVDYAIYQQGATFAPSLRRFLHGEEDARLIERAKAIEGGLPAPIREAALKLGAEGLEDRMKAAAALVPEIESLTLYLAWLKARAANERQRRQAGLLLSSYFGTLKPQSPGSRLPYGCSGPEHHDPCPSCGLGNISPRARMYLRFISIDPPRKRRGND